MKKLYCDKCGKPITNIYFGTTNVFDGVEHHYHIDCINFKPAFEEEQPKQKFHTNVIVSAPKDFYEQLNFLQ